MSTFTETLAKICQEEYARFDNGKGKEWENPYSGYIGEYWQSINIKHLEGKTKTSAGIRPAWSAAFVSFCIRKAGAGKAFRYGQAHCHYINSAMLAADGGADDYGYLARDTKHYRPKVGDILCAGRSDAKRFDYETAKTIYVADSWYPSHGDIVVDVRDGEIRTIGGNVSNSVKMKIFSLNQNGYVRDRMISGKSYPWIALLECRL